MLRSAHGRGRARQHSKLARVAETADAYGWPISPWTDGRIAGEPAVATG